ncbi:UNVERIFIED_CONTAM: hypothetical protein IGO34_28330 [Salmonella enterica subsp. enterica serovar Weltevreden]
MAQFTAAGWPRRQVSEVRDLRVLSGVVLDGYAPLDLRLRGSGTADPSRVLVEIIAAATSPPC